MPRGKYVNHKGRSRHFTSPEELQQELEESSEEEESGSEEEEEGGAAASSSSAKSRSKPKTRVKKHETSSEDSEGEWDEESEEDRDARKGVASLIEIENPNRAVKKAAQKVQNLALDDAEAEPELSRREREQIEKQKARMLYKKLHAAGKTPEAKADLARLALIRQQRAEAAAKREAEKKALEEKKGAGSKV